MAALLAALSDHADPELLRFACWALELLAAQAGSRDCFTETLHQVMAIILVCNKHSMCALLLKGRVLHVLSSVNS